MKIISELLHSFPSPSSLSSLTVIQNWQICEQKVPETNGPALLDLCSDTRPTSRRVALYVVGLRWRAIDLPHGGPVKH